MNILYYITVYVLQNQPYFFLYANLFQYNEPLYYYLYEYMYSVHVCTCYCTHMYMYSSIDKMMFFVLHFLSTRWEKTDTNMAFKPQQVMFQRYAFSTNSSFSLFLHNMSYLKYIDLYLPTLYNIHNQVSQHTYN